MKQRSQGAVVAAVALAGLAGGVALRRTLRAARAPVTDPHLGEDFTLTDSDRGTEVRTDDGVALAVREVGPRDAPTTVIFVHGFSNAMASFVLQRKSLHATWGPTVRLVFVDQRGHGRSGTPPVASCTIEQLGRDVISVVDAVAPLGDVVLIGHSMGGMAVMAAARQRGELFGTRITGVGLLSSTAAELSATGLGRALRNPLLDGFSFATRSSPRLLERSRVAAKALIWPILQAASYRTPVGPTLSRFTNEMIDDTRVGTIGAFLKTLRLHDEAQALPVLAKIPVLMASGSSDVIVPFAGVEAMAQDLPDCELVRIDGAGHMAHLEFPELVDAAIERLVVRAGQAKRTDG